jgi:DNA replication protein DnaC
MSTESIYGDDIPVTCVGCSAQFQSPTNCVGRVLFRSCPSCRKKIERELAAENRREQDRKLCSVIPLLYLRSDRSKMNAALLACIDAFDIDSRQGLFISGKIGTCKTRSACLLLQRYCYAGYSIQMAQSTGLAELFVSQFRDKEGKESRERLQSIKWAHALLIDDIGKERATERYEIELFALLESRTSNMLPTIYTSNLGLKDLHAKFSRDQGLAIIRRIHEFCECVPVTLKNV